MGSRLFYVLLFLQPPVQPLECCFAQCFRQGPHNSLSLLLCAELSDEGLHCRESGSAHVSFVSKDLNVISWGPPFWSTLGFHTHSHPYTWVYICDSLPARHYANHSSHAMHICALSGTVYLKKIHSPGHFILISYLLILESSLWL